MNWKNKLQGFKFDLELAAIALVYFVQGALGLAHLAVSFFLKDELGLSPANVAALIGIAMVPWTVKPLYGFVSDGLPIFGYRRRPYLVLSSCMGAAAWLAMATVVKTPLAATLAMGMASLSVAFSDAITDALVVQRARLEPEGDAGSLQSFSWAAVSVGAITSAYFSGFLLEHFGIQLVFKITAVLPLLVGVAAFAIADVRISRQEARGEGQEVDSTRVMPHAISLPPQIGKQLQQLRQAVTSKEIWLPALFIFLWQATPTADSAFFFFTTNELHFNPEFLGTVRLVTSLAGLAGVWIFQRYLKHVPIRRIFLWTTVISAVLGLTSLMLVTHANRAIGIDDRWFSLGDSLVLSVAGRIAYMPVLVLAARLCPEGVEATLFALLMSVINVASLCSYQLGAGLTYLMGITESNFNHLALLLVITNLSTLLPLPLLQWLPGDNTNISRIAPGQEPVISAQTPIAIQLQQPEEIPDAVNI